MRDVYIVECVRSPLGRGKKGGSLSTVRPVDLLAAQLAEVVKRANLDAKYVEDVVCGCVTPLNEQGGNIARLGLLKAGYPVSVPGVQLNRMCGSGQQAIHFIAQEIASGDTDIGVACGVEMMSVEKMGKDLPVPAFMKLLGDFPYKLVPQGQSAEKIAETYGISRDECDELAFESHRRCGLARDKGLFDHQIVPHMVLKDKKSKQYQEVYQDEGIRYPPSMDSIKSLKSVFRKKGVVSAGNASQITDGASAVLLASADAVKKFGLRVRARVISRAVVGSDPIMMLDGVIPATQKVLNQVGMKVDDIDLFEINEAFAVVPIAWRKTLGIDWNKVNICGGACAHGHPLGATGCVLMTKLVNDLEREDKKYGLQTMCIGWGMATATVIERTNKVLPPRTDNLRAKL
mmetsp:Transcript_46150/g.73967  ORF Transcript_46150/g.73967 Transcript_46150/m.73967 type:complete len:403 (+) Transcript_46150:71-1279(+)|eukprot:CAMPEP_0197023496 /NCGR_PEP_ID=MMETSP1384-20130603/4172_1 /TAXON_ID=29189 /ORGANISM="Ammonia sp." /LENGTH=402 /DNA_ID=CAMNT_0042451711 /DNA_START=46 /DNA_END=1254 /DNA_ORIENTATION=-